MQAHKLISVVAALAFIGACATTETEKPKPAPAPAPAPRAEPPKAVPAPPPPIAAAPAPAPAAPTPAPAPAAPKKPSVITVTSTELFEFNKAVLTADARAKLDKEVVARFKDFSNVSLVHVDGHADRLGSPSYNQKLSEKRAEAVRAYLVSKGFEDGRIEVLGSGKTLPVKSCPDQKNRKDLIECLAPNRRVVVEMKGTPR